MSETHEVPGGTEPPGVKELDREYLQDDPSVEFAALLEESPDRSYKEVSVGERVSGTVQEIRGASAFIDYGGRSEGVIDLEELRDDSGEVRYSTGDPIEVYVAAAEDEVQLTLSLRASNRQILRQAYRNEVPVDGRVTGFNTGGLVVSLGGVRAFCPFSQVDTGYCEEPASYAGKTLTFKIVEFRGGGRNVVLSRRAHLEAEARRQADELRAKLEEGAEASGRVTRVERFGAFVDLGGVEGLVHISELSHTRVAQARDFISPGEEVKVRILELKDLGTEKERISLSIKALEPDPWDETAERLREGDTVTGKVVSIQKFGAFVEVVPGVEGLVHVSQLSGKRVARPGDVVSVGREATARIQSVDRGQKRISLSMRALEKAATKAAEVQDMRDFKVKQDKGKDDQGSMADALRRAGLI